MVLIVFSIYARYTSDGYTQTHNCILNTTSLPPSPVQRQPKVDIDSDSSSDEYPDLSASFEQILHERRPDLQRKMNVQQNAATPSKSAAMAEPQHHLHIHQQHHDADDDADTSSMNRLFVHCDLNAPGDAGEMTARSMLDDADEPSMFERLSPCKRIGLLRPSTVLEDSSGEEEEEQEAQEAEEGATNNSTLSAEVSVDVHDTDETSFGTAATTASAAAAAAAVHETSFETARTSSAQKRSAVLKRMSSAAYATRDSLAAAADDDSLDEDSLNQPQQPLPPVSDAPHAFDDTLEVVEYDHNAPSYVLKPVLRTISAVPLKSDATPKRRQPTASDGDDDVIVVESDSSPETSFHTARSRPATVKKERSLFPQTRSFYADDSAGELPGCEVITLDSDSECDEDESADVAADAEPIETHHSDVYEAESHRNTSGTSSIGPSVSQADVRDHAADIDAALDESLALHANIPDEFNDTIERMDYLMELGRRIQQKQQQQSASKVLPPSSSAASVASPIARNSPRLATSVPNSSSKQTPSASDPSRPAATFAASPAVATTATSSSTSAATGAASKKLFRTPVTKNSPILKPKPTVNSPAPKFHPPITPIGGVFKKPTVAASASGGAMKKTTPAHSRIPKAKSATKYDYVVSPIGAYIGRIAPNPMQQNVVVERDFLDSTYCRNASKELDFTLPAANAENEPPARCPLPKKAYKQAERAQVSWHFGCSEEGGWKFD